MQRSDLVERLVSRLEGGGSAPVSHLVVEEIWLAVIEGALDIGERLPTARQLAIALGINPRSIERAYDELARRGVIIVRQGAGTIVSLAPPSEEERARHRAFAELCEETVQRARELGFPLEALLDALAEYRTVDTETPTEES